MVDSGGRSSRALRFVVKSRSSVVKHWKAERALRGDFPAREKAIQELCERRVKVGVSKPLNPLG